MTATTTTSGVASSSSGSFRASVGDVVKMCVSNVALGGSTWTPALFAPTTAGADCRTWTVV